MMQLFSSFAADELSRALGVPLLQRAQSIAATTDPVTTITMRAEKRIEKKPYDGSTERTETSDIKPNLVAFLVRKILPVKRSLPGKRACLVLTTTKSCSFLVV